MNGALAIADVLGIYGRENLYAAAYWRFPKIGSPGFNAFKMYTNYDDQGGRFGGTDGGTSVQAQSDHPDLVTSYAARDTSGNHMYLMLINKDPDQAANASIVLNGFSHQSLVDVYHYGNDHPEGITHEQIQAPTGDLNITLPAYSITLLVLGRSG